jgi:6-phospho-3-hexuloisomerase
VVEKAVDLREAAEHILGEVGSILHQVDAEAAERLADAVLSARRIYVAGEGRSGLVARTFAMRLVHLGMTACVCGETTTPAIEAGDLCIACSGSGETVITCHRARQSRRVGAKVAAIVAATGSALGAEADIEIILPAPTKLSPGATASRQFGASLFEQALLLFLDALVLLLQERRSTSRESMSAKHSNLE